MTSNQGLRARNPLYIARGSYVTKLMMAFTHIIGAVRAMPSGLHKHKHSTAIHSSESMSPKSFYINLLASACLVLAGGIFAGLTLGLMGQDEVYLKVIASSGDSTERKHARKVLKLIGRGKHWVLVTLLLSNVITNESLPIVLDRCLGGGWPAVVASTVSIVIFGEIIPQSVCVRYGLQVGSLFAPFVLFLMYIMYPFAYPISMLLDHILGEDHGTVYKKSGLKTLVTLHQTMGVERLNEDEVTIISAVLDLKEKSVSQIMTPIDRVYTLSADAILDEVTVEEIFNAGFSRIPIHLPGEPSNYIGMLLVRVLISYDPEDALPVATFPLATLPETGVDTSCLNILNYFQEGKSHMVVVSRTPGETTGAMGVLTLEDVIEELIGEEIVDESDVFIDINKNIRRTQPGPLSKRNLTSYLHNMYHRSKKEENPNSPWNQQFEDDEQSKEKVKARNELQSRLNTLDATTWKLHNPADNPLDIGKSFVKIKKTDIKSVKDNVLTPSKKEKFDHHETTQAPITISTPKHSNDLFSASENGNEMTDNEIMVTRSTDITENGIKGLESVYDEHPELDNPGTQISQGRSYRTGGIIESVINVKGVHKTIIENVSDGDDDSDIHRSIRDDSSNKKGSHEDLENGDEYEPFLNGNQENGLGVKSDGSSGRRQSVWKKLTSSASSIYN